MRCISLNTVFSIAFLLISTCVIYAQNVSGVEVVHKIEPGSNNPRNSEGDFITLKDGRILFIYSRYSGTSTSDQAPAHLAYRSSTDGGKTWNTEDKLVVAQEGEMNVMSVSLLRLQDGRIALWYLKKNSEFDCIPMLRYSSDEAQTWSEPIACVTDKKGYFVLNNNRVIQLNNGRLLMAVAWHKPIGGKWTDKAVLFSYYSEDNGLTWKSSPEVPNTTNVITQEPGVVELKDGKIMMFIRASGGKQWLSFSDNKGETWSSIVESDIHSPLSPASITRIPKTNYLLLVWNNNPIVEKKWHGGVRTPLTVAISKDEGKTWINQKNIEVDTDGWYCYTAIHFTKKDVLLGYCAGSQSKKTELSVTNLTKINKKWFYKK